MNYFELFGLPVHFIVDKSELARKYFELQKKYHPDFFSQETELEQSAALEMSSQVNKALKILRNQDECIKYVLQLKGVLEEEEKFQLPADFLLEMMDLNESLSDNSLQQINQLEQELYTAVSGIIEHFNYELTTRGELEKVKEYYYKKKYLQRILDRMSG